MRGKDEAQIVVNDQKNKPRKTKISWKRRNWYSLTDRVKVRKGKGFLENKRLRSRGQNRMRKQ